MTLIEIIMTAEEEGIYLDNEELIEGIAEYRDTLRQLQGSWGRLIHRMEEEEII